MAGTKLPPIDILRMHRLLGDWQNLAALRDLDLANCPERNTLVLMAIEGCQQLGMWDETRALVAAAMQWGTPREDVARAMIAAVHNSLGLSCNAAGMEASALTHFHRAVHGDTPGLDFPEFANARASYQAKLQKHQVIPPGAGKSDQDLPAPRGGINSYAQNFEDVMLWRALGGVENGFYIDIGAQDPIYDSVSKGFYEKGWRGVHAEPSPHYAEMLRQDRPDETVLEVAVARESGEIIYYEIPETGISTCVEEIAVSHATLGFRYEKRSVRTVTLAEILELYCMGRAVHWLKIDVEGMEDEVLEGWESSENLPWIVVVESTRPLSTEETHSKWEWRLTSRGYEFAYFDGLNRFYVHPDHSGLAARFECPPNVFDEYRLRRVSIVNDLRQNER